VLRTRDLKRRSIAEIGIAEYEPSRRALDSCVGRLAAAISRAISFATDNTADGPEPRGCPLGRERGSDELLA